MPNYWLSSSALSTTLGVHELKDPVENSSRTSFSATAYLKCPWVNRDAVINDLLINLVLYPRLPLYGARATSCSATFFGGTIQDNQLMVPEEAQITVNYTQGQEDDGSGNIFSETLEPNAEFITLNHKKFRWGSATGRKVEPEEAPGKLIVGFDYVQTRYNLSALPIEILSPNVVNDAPVAATLLGLTFPTETLLYVNSVPSRTIDSAGNDKWTMPSRFSYRENGWNKFWNPAAGTNGDWERIYKSTEYGGAQYNNFPLEDISGLLV